MRLERAIVLGVSLALAMTGAGGASDWYVAPDGTPDADGSRDRPWDLATALNHPGSVRPGDTIWLRGGRSSGEFKPRLGGAEGSPIVVRQRPGEHAVVDGSFTITDSRDVWFWGFEVTRSRPAHAAPYADDAGWNVSKGANLKFINLVVQEHSRLGFGFWTPAIDGEINGCLIFNNGTTDDPRGGHAIYVQNATGRKRVQDNIMFNQTGFGIHAYTERGRVDNLDFEGNISFNNGATMGHSRSNLTLQGRPKNCTVVGNFTYFPPEAFGKQGVQFISKPSDSLIKDNYWIGGETALRVQLPTDVTIRGNTFYGKTDGFAEEDFPDNSYLTARPAGVKTFVRPNKYEPGRAHVVIYNWDLRDEVVVDISGIGLKSEDRYEVRDVQDFSGKPVAGGVYRGQAVSIPMKGLTAAPPLGKFPKVPRHTAPEFGVFVVVPTQGR
jgi:hypothetical protein